jgi:hypothetical protein
VKRAPIDANPVMNKYKQRTFTASENLRSLKAQSRTTRNQDKKAFYDTNPIKYLNGQKRFKEDASHYDPNIQQLTHHEPLSDGQYSQFHEASRLTTANQQLSAFDGITAGQQHLDGNKPLLYSQNTQRDTGIKDKLESLRKLFADEEMND